MARDVTSGVQVGIAAPSVPMAMAIEAQFETRTVRVWTGIAPILWGGHTWTALGDMVGLDTIEEGTDISARGVAISLSGVNSSLLTLALDDDYRGKPVIIHVLFLNETFTAVAASYQIFAGRMDTMAFEDAGETSSITMQCENHLVDLQRPRIRRYTHEEQQQILPGDRGLEFVAALAEKPLYWGVPPPT